MSKDQLTFPVLREHFFSSRSTNSHSISIIKGVFSHSIVLGKWWLITNGFWIKPCFQLREIHSHRSHYRGLTEKWDKLQKTLVKSLDAASNMRENLYKMLVDWWKVTSNVTHFPKDPHCKGSQSPSSSCWTALEQT